MNQQNLYRLVEIYTTIFHFRGQSSSTKTSVLFRTLPWMSIRLAGAKTCSYLISILMHWSFMSSYELERLAVATSSRLLIEITSSTNSPRPFN